MKFFIILFLLQILIIPSANCTLVKTSFFENFEDEYLNKYIQQGIYNNHNLKSIGHKVKQYRWEISNTFSKELPHLRGGARYLGNHFPNGDENFLIKQNSFIVPFIANYELDYLLKNRDKTKSKKKLYEKELFKEKSDYISLISDIANCYINIMLYDYLIEKQALIIKNKSENLIFNKEKFHYGIIDLINLSEETEALEIQKVIYNNLIKFRKKLLYNFTTLISISPNCTQDIKRSKLINFEYKKEIPKEINSNIIYKRPDLISLENELKSLKLDISIAKKEFFPNFNIIGAYILDTAGRGNFFSWESTFAFLLAGITQDIFLGGKKIANLKIKKERFLEIMEKYKQTDLIAIQEINTALFSIKEDKKSEESLIKQVNYEKIKLTSQNEKYKQGTISNIELLNSENSLYQQEQLWANSKTCRLCDYINLYKAVGGEL